MSRQDGEKIILLEEKIILLEKRIRQLEDWTRDEEYKRIQQRIKLNESVLNKEKSLSLLDLFYEKETK